MSEFIPQDWKTDNLFVLVGGNPLPNYVAAHTLLRPEGWLHLVYSTDTRSIAGKLASYFVEDRVKTHSLDDPSNGAEIRSLISTALKAHCKPGSIGLHYTGGTKAMSVHTYQVIDKMHPKAIFTYLDARTLQMRRDDQVNPQPAKFATKPTVADLFTLHDIKLQRPIPTEAPNPIFPDLEKALVQAHANKAGATAYDQWCKEYLRDPQTNKLVEKNTQFRQRPLPFPTATVLEPVANAMRIVLEESGAGFEPEVVVARVKAKTSIQKIKHLVEYLDGKWLEQWTLAAFLANQTKGNLHSFATSLETHQEEARLQFEFDVAAMQGYQLYAVSCTRDASKTLCKSKLFEAFIRASQLGGDEARVGLVCAYDQPAALQSQVAEGHRVSKNRMRVFGAGELEKLPEHFAQWLCA
jgi:hypothetical protein